MAVYKIARRLRQKENSSTWRVSGMLGPVSLVIETLPWSCFYLVAGPL